jgi:hypothetical protein
LCPETTALRARRYALKVPHEVNGGRFGFHENDEVIAEFEEQPSLAVLPDRPRTFLSCPRAFYTVERAHF